MINGSKGSNGSKAPRMPFEIAYNVMFNKVFIWSGSAQFIWTSN